MLLYEWDSDDMTNLMSAKKSHPGGSNKSDRQVSNISGNAVQCKIRWLVRGSLAIKRVCSIGSGLKILCNVLLR